MTSGFSIRAAAFVAIVFASPTSLSAQAVDAAVEAVSGTGALRADLRVEVLTGSTAAIGAEETWEVVGACSNAPTVRVEFLTGIGALNAQRRIQLVKGTNAIFATRRICITNADRLDPALRALLTLSD